MASKKASARKTAPRRTAAAEQSAAREAQRRRTVSATAGETQSVRQLARTRARAIQAHIQSRGRKQQARRDSR